MIDWLIDWISLKCPVVYIEQCTASLLQSFNCSITCQIYDMIFLSKLIGILLISCKTLAAYLNISSGSRKWKLNPEKPPALGPPPPPKGYIDHIIIIFKRITKIVKCIALKRNPWWSGQTRLVSLMKTSFD